MYGLIGKMTAVPGRRDELAAILLEGTDAMGICDTEGARAPAHSPRSLPHLQPVMLH